MKDIECIAAGCGNRRSEGLFIGELCAPCYKMIATGDFSGQGSTDIHDRYKRMIEAEREIKKYRELLKEILSWIENSGEWWLDDPGRGGFDSEKIERALKNE